MSYLKNRFSNFFESRKSGFYLSAIAAVLSIVVAILYVCGYHNSKYMSWLVFALLLIAGVLYVPFAFFKETEQFAPVVTGGLSFIAFMAFIRYTYLYLSEAFFNGEFGGFTPEFIVFACCVVFMLAGIVLSNIAIYKKQGDDCVKTTEEMLS